MYPPFKSDPIDPPRARAGHAGRSPRMSSNLTRTGRLAPPEMGIIRPPNHHSNGHSNDVPILTDTTDVFEEPGEILSSAPSISTQSSTTLPAIETHPTRLSHQVASAITQSPSPSPSPSPQRSLHPNGSLSPYQSSPVSPSSPTQYFPMQTAGSSRPQPVPTAGRASHVRTSSSRVRMPASPTTSRQQTSRSTGRAAPRHTPTLMAGLGPTLQTATATSAPNIDRHFSDPTAPERFWESYAAEAFSVDHRMIASWHRNLDVRLIFAALFSAILTPFIIESYKLLDPNSSVHAFGKDGFRIRVNCMWFGSLILSLITALLSIHCKQWLDAYGTGIDLKFSQELLSRVRDLEGLPDEELQEDLDLDSTQTDYQARLQSACRLRQYRYQGLQKYYIHQVIGLLPVLLYLCLLFFAVGLIDWLWHLNRDIAKFVLCLCVIVAIFHIITTVIPFFTTRSPYKTPLSTLLGNLWRGARKRRFPISGLMDEEENEDIEAQRDMLDKNSAEWLMSTTRSEVTYEQSRRAMREWKLRKTRDVSDGNGEASRI